MRLVTWNVNSIRTRLGRVLDWLEHHRPDVVALQETRCPDTAFPYAEFGAAGYETAHHGVDHRNGVAICSRVGLGDVAYGFPPPQRPPFDEARLVAATCGGIRVWSAYVPNGRELWHAQYAFKLVWLERLRGLLEAVGVGDGPSAVMGDFNVAPSDLDIYDPRRWRNRTHASPPERAAIDALLDLGLVDVVRDRQPGAAGLFTWWNYRISGFAKDQGLRIDLALLSSSLAGRVEATWVDREERGGDRPSDHAPVVVDLD